jgi:hypothetical protein
MAATSKPFDLDVDTPKYSDCPIVQEGVKRFRYMDSELKKPRPEKTIPRAMEGYEEEMKEVHEALTYLVNNVPRTELTQESRCLYLARRAQHQRDIASEKKLSKGIPHFIAVPRAVVIIRAKGVGFADSVGGNAPSSTVTNQHSLLERSSKFLRFIHMQDMFSKEMARLVNAAQVEADAVRRQKELEVFEASNKPSNPPTPSQEDAEQVINTIIDHSLKDNPDYPHPLAKPTGARSTSPVFPPPPPPPPRVATPAPPPAPVATPAPVAASSSSSVASPPEEDSSDSSDSDDSETSADATPVRKQPEQRQQQMRENSPSPSRQQPPQQQQVEPSRSRSPSFPYSPTRPDWMPTSPSGAVHSPRVDQRDNLFNSPFHGDGGEGDQEMPPAATLTVSSHPSSDEVVVEEPAESEESDGSEESGIEFLSAAMRKTPKRNLRERKPKEKGKRKAAKEVSDEEEEVHAKKKQRQASGKKVVQQQEAEPAAAVTVEEEEDVMEVGAPIALSGPFTREEQLPFVNAAGLLNAGPGRLGFLCQALYDCRDCLEMDAVAFETVHTEITNFLLQKRPEDQAPTSQAEFAERVAALQNAMGIYPDIG